MTSHTSWDKGGRNKGKGSEGDGKEREGAEAIKEGGKKRRNQVGGFTLMCQRL